MIAFSFASLSGRPAAAMISAVHFGEMLKALPYLLLMIAVVPLAGFCVTGSLRHAWRYSKIWFSVVGGMVALAGSFFLLGIAADWLFS